MRSDNLAKVRVGQVRKNRYGSIMKIIKYNNNNDMWVEFEQGDLIHTTWDHFQKGTVKYYYDKTVYGVGFLGKGIYKSVVDKKHTPQYQIWQQMIRRCYDEKMWVQYPTYKDCTVAEEWHNFQNFAKWYDENYYEVEGERITLDKDILIKRNKMYSPETCVFVPQKINAIFVKMDSSRGELPIGVDFRPLTGRYRSKCRTGKDIRITKTFDTPEEAFEFYKTHKEQHIKEIAEKYREKIPFKLYKALVKYEVEITD